MSGPVIRPARQRCEPLTRADRLAIACFMWLAGFVVALLIDLAFGSPGLRALFGLAAHHG